MFRSSSDTIRVPEKEIIDVRTCYNCDLCSEGRWTSEADVEIHRRKVHRLKLLELLRKEKSHMCTVCLRPQKSSTSLINHIKTEHLLTPPDSSRVEREIFICDLCNNLFFNKKLLIAHLHHTHAKNEIKKTIVLECPKCSKHILGKSLWFHFLSHHILSWSTCPICLTYFENIKRMLEHVKTHTGYYYCAICGYSTNREHFFNSHIRRHYKKVLPDTKTKEEDVSRFFLPGNKHILGISKVTHLLKGVPMSSLIQICVICRAMCMDEEEMRQHIYGEHAPEREVTPKTHMCACGAKFFNNVLLKHHVFKLKGEHRALMENETPNVQENNYQAVFEILGDNCEVVDVEFEAPMALDS